MAAHRECGRSGALRTLVATEAFERLAYCGTQLLLTLYLAATLAGGGEAHRTFKALFGPLDPIAMTAQVMALFFAATHLATLLGARLATTVDRRLVVAGGGALMTAGHFSMCVPTLLVPALLLLVAGAGCTVSNKPTQVGLLYRPGDGRRAQGFATYTIGLNLGVLLAPLICGTLGERVGWAWGFAAAGTSMGVGLACYLAGWATLPHDRPIARSARPPRHPGDRQRIATILIALLPYVVILAVVNQAYTLVIVWASTHTARDVGGFVVPVTWLLVVDGAAAIGALLLAKTVWRRRGDGDGHGRELGRVALGCAWLAVAYCWLAGIAAGGVASLLPVVGFFLLLEIGVAWVDAPLEAWVSARAPAQHAGIMMALLKATAAAGALLLGWLGRFYQPLGATGFWLLNAVLAAAALLAVLGVRRIAAPPSYRVREPASTATAAATSDWR